MSELLCSYSSFEYGIDDRLDGEKTVSGIKDGKRSVPEGEWLGITYGKGERSIFGEPVLVMVLEPVLGTVLGTTHR